LERNVHEFLQLIWMKIGDVDDHGRPIAAIDCPSRHANFNSDLFVHVTTNRLWSFWKFPFGTLEIFLT
jgi:hypothetical protein